MFEDCLESTTDEIKLKHFSFRESSLSSLNRSKTSVLFNFSSNAALAFAKKLELENVLNLVKFQPRARSRLICILCIVTRY